MKEAVIEPFEIEQVEALTAFPDNLQVRSAVEKPDPVTSTVEPAAAEIGLIVMDGRLRGEVV